LDAPESAAGDQLADFLVMRAIAMLMTDNCLDAAFGDEIADLKTFGGSQGDGFSMAMSLAPLSMPILTIEDRILAGCKNRTRRDARCARLGRHRFL